MTQSLIASSRARVVLGSMIVFSLLTTTLHYAHNFHMAEHYPPVPLFFPNATSYRVGIVIFWPLLTVVGIWGYHQLTCGRFRQAAYAEGAYALLGFTTIFHFVGGVPDIPALFMVTIFTDFVAGCLLLGFAWWALQQSRRHPARG